MAMKPLLLNYKWPNHTLLESALSHLQVNLQHVAVPRKDNSDDKVKHVTHKIMNFQKYETT